MRANPSINTFTINLPVNGQDIRVILCLFSKTSFQNGKKINSYSIVAKISGINCDSASADVIADYGAGKVLNDRLLILYNQFIYSNQGTSPVSLNITMRLKGMLSWRGVIEASFNIRLLYNLRCFVINDVRSEYRLKNTPESKLLLMQ